MLLTDIKHGSFKGDPPRRAHHCQSTETSADQHYEHRKLHLLLVSGGLGASQMTLGVSLGLLGGPLSIQGDPQEVLDDLWGLPRTLLETSFFTFWGGEFVNGIMKYDHFQVGHDGGQRPESVHQPSFLHNFHSYFLKYCDVNMM